MATASVTGADVDVLVVGGGPTGLMMANQLTRRGVRTLVVDRHAGPSRETRALGVQARTLEIYARLGVVQRALEWGKRGNGADIWAEGRRLARIPLGQAGDGVTPYPYILILGQDDNERILGDHLRELGNDVQWNTELVGLEPLPDGVAATLRQPDGSTELRRARYVAGCDGAHSAVRRLNGIDFPGAPYEHVFFVADVEATGTMVPDDVNVYLWRAGFHLFFPMRGVDHWRIVGIVPAALRERKDVAFDDVAPSIHGEAGIGLSIRGCSWFSTYRIHHRAASRFRAGRCFVLGDAAHIHSPVGAQGMNTGLQDAYNLGWKLALVVQGRASPALLDSYEAERRPVAEGVLEMTSRATMLAFGHTMMATTLRDVVVAPLVRTRWVQRRATQAMSQLDVSYSRGPLGSVGRLSWPRGLVAGDRVPNRLCTRRDGTAVRLHDTLGPGWALIGTEALVDMARERLGDVASLRGGARGNAMLVRPDGHLGWRGSRPAAMSDWLDRLCGPRTSSARGGHGRRAGRDI